MSWAGLSERPRTRSCLDKRRSCQRTRWDRPSGQTGSPRPHPRPQSRCCVRQSLGNLGHKREFWPGRQEPWALTPDLTLTRSLSSGLGLCPLPTVSHLIYKMGLATFDRQVTSQDALQLEQWWLLEPQPWGSHFLLHRAFLCCRGSKESTLWP